MESYGPSLILVAFDKQGKETDRLEVTGSFATEGYQSENKGFKMDQDGNISFYENSLSGEYSDNFLNENDDRMIKVNISEDGHFIRTCTDIKIVVNKFNPVKQGNSQEEGKPYTNSEMLGSFEDWNLSVLLDTYQEKSGRAIRLITANKSGQILGTVMLDNTFTNADVKFPTTIDKGITEYGSFGTIGGPVTISIGDKTYAITKDGTITAQ